MPKQRIADDLDRIEAAVAAAEQSTAGEIVVVVTDSSEVYGEVRAAAAGLLTAGGVGLWQIVAGPFAASLWWDPGVLGRLEGPLAVAALAGWMLWTWTLSGRPWLLRRLIGADRAAAAVERAAQAAFIARGLTETRDRSGVLLYVSWLEHRVHLLADRGIHERVGVAGWQRHVDELIEAIRSGRPGDGLVAAIEAIGQELAVHFPPRTDDRDELPNEIAVGLVPDTNDR
jgi:putative membrane protein